MAEEKARLVQLTDANNLPIVPRVSSQGVVMSDGTTLETYIDEHGGGGGKLSHSLTIGDKVFDGTKDVVVEVYNGEMNDENILRMIPSNNNMTLI